MCGRILIHLQQRRQKQLVRRRRRTTTTNNNNMCYKGMGRFFMYMCTYIRRSAIKIIASHCVYYVLNYEYVFLWMFSLYISLEKYLCQLLLENTTDTLCIITYIPSHVQHIPIRRTYIHNNIIHTYIYSMNI